MISSDKLQSKAQFNLQSLGENETGYRAENIFFLQIKTSIKVNIWFVHIAFLYPHENLLQCKGMLGHCHLQ